VLAGRLWGRACTSDGLAKDGIALVGMGGSVYTMKSAFAMCSPAALARRASALERCIADRWDVELRRAVVVST
jgi:hypothetical protein